jgi:DNA polymerase III epsilon subunit-like protein
MKGTTVFFDLETGGTEDDHPNIQIAAVAVRDWNEVDSFEVKIDFDENLCDPKALKVNGYKPEDWKNAVLPDEAARRFDAFCTKHADLTLISARTGKPYTVARLAGHNVTSFDVPRTRRMMDAAGVRFWKACWWYPLDTYQRAIWYFTESLYTMPPNFQMQTLAKFLGLPAQGAEHEALADARLCVQLARHLMGGGKV